ncbi:hypothetical protein EDC94DRAFT_634000 [Helicostylum pulchrum]|nr:hypothetical protein EDC94DRAFT_634000 [Helicostylum pulchrum]
MAFTGYVFKSLQEIEPYLEDAETGPSVLWAKEKGQVNYNSLCCVNPAGKLVSTLGKVGFGICMDINPYQFKSDFYDCEFANYHLKQNTEIIICCMAWLKNKEDDDCMSTIRYWAMRLLPLYSDAEEGRHTIFAACNRIGLERGSDFGGASCVLDISNESITILDYMKRDIGVMIVETE